MFMGLSVRKVESAAVFAEIRPKLHAAQLVYAVYHFFCYLH